MKRLALIGGLLALQACLSPVLENPDGGEGGGTAGGGTAGGASAGGVGGNGASGGGGASPCVDDDHDGFVAGAVSSCSSKPAGDCNDHDAQVHPAANELCSNGRDDNCDGLVDSQDPSCGGLCSAMCRSSFDCHLGTTFCGVARDPNPTPVCCAQCPKFEGDCPMHTSPRPAGLDPLTGCQRTACIDDMTTCPALYQPVCGTNGQTYGNPCELNRAEAELLHSGACVPGEGVACRSSQQNSCGASGALYCRDACPQCDSLLERCTKVGVCVTALDCPAGLATPALCPNGSAPRASCVLNACNYVCQ